MCGMVIFNGGAPECVPRLAKKVNRATHRHQSTTRGHANQTDSEGIEGDKRQNLLTVTQFEVGRLWTLKNQQVPHLSF